MTEKMTPSQTRRRHLRRQPPAEKTPAAPPLRAAPREFSRSLNIAEHVAGNLDLRF